MKLGRVEETLPLFEKSLQLKPDNVLTINSYANALMKLERVEDTLPLFEKSLQLEPDNVLTINSYANALMKLERVEDSLPWFEKSLKLEPDHVLTINNYAGALMELKRVEDSLPWFQKALLLEPDDVIIINNYAGALMELERVEDSLPLFEKALQLEPDHVKTIRSYANALMKLERVEDSLPWFEKALLLEPDNFIAIGSYAIALMKLERVEDSLPWFEKALLLEPDNVIAIGSYAIALIEVGKFEESCQFFEKSLELEDDNYVRYKYATALQELGQYQQAIEQLEKINLTDLLQDNANVVRLTLGRLYYSIEEEKKGNQYFQEAIDNSEDRERSLLYSASSILAKLANKTYDKKDLEMLDEIAQDLGLYAHALKMLTLNLDSEGYYEEIKPETKLKDTQILNRAIYHKIGNEIAVLKSIAYRILRGYKDKNSNLNDIIEKIEKLVEQITERREIQKYETNKIPEDDYQQVLSVISKTAHDISDFVNNELAVIKSKILRVMRKVDSESKIYSQYEKLLTQLELTQAALNDLKGINEGINIKKKHFPVKKIFEKWQDNNQIENAEIQLEITNGDSIFSGDEEKIKSALNEMLENSLKHNSDQQNLMIKMKSQDAINPESIRGFTMSGEKKYLLIEFSDNGKGIPEDKKQWIFQPLTTTSKKGQGSGLGLYIIRKTLVKMEGHIRETGENGVRFEMYIPYTDR
ncbi:MAG: tetratricopeptide repeat protein [Okeania sp. SIO3B5]|nr:tetratricopeptide repeat protein [Okeania sp. SIO3B5]